MVSVSQVIGGLPISALQLSPIFPGIAYTQSYYTPQITPIYRGRKFIVASL